MSFVVRQMTPKDFEPVAAWMAPLSLLQRYGLTPLRAVAQFQQAQFQGDVLLTVDAGSPIGVAWLMPAGAFGRSAYLRLIAVHPDYAGHGIGAALLDTVETHASGGLFLLVSDFNTDAQRFYHRQGYTQIGAIPDYVVAGITELIFWKRPGAARAR